MLHSVSSIFPYDVSHNVSYSHNHEKSNNIETIPSVWIFANNYKMTVHGLNYSVKYIDLIIIRSMVIYLN